MDLVDERTQGSGKFDELLYGEVGTLSLVFQFAVGPLCRTALSPR